MKITIKETRIFTLDVRSEPRAKQKQVEEEAIRQLNALRLEPTSLIPSGSFDLWKDGTVKEGNKLATCEVQNKPTIEKREILSIVGQ
jgi:hypothetical protein